MSYQHQRSCSRPQRSGPRPSQRQLAQPRRANRPATPANFDPSWDHDPRVAFANSIQQCVRNESDQGNPTDARTIRKRRPAAAWRARAEMAGGPHDPPRRGHQPGDRPPLRPRRAVAPAGASVLVPVVRRGDGHGLAFLRHHHQRHRRAEARADAARKASSASMSAAAAAGIRGRRRRSWSRSASASASTAPRWRRPAGWSPRSTAPRCRTASSSICTASSSPTTATGSSCSRA